MINHQAKEDPKARFKRASLNLPLDHGFIRGRTFCLRADVLLRHVDPILSFPNGVEKGTFLMDS